MAKVGYIFLANSYDKAEADKKWMQEYGCIKIVEEPEKDEKLRPEWKLLLASLQRGDELVISKFSNALRGPSELSFFLELCRVKVIRVISLHDMIDSCDEVFPPLRTSDLLSIVGSLPSEAASIRNAAAHAKRILAISGKSKSKESKQIREGAIVNMYNAGHSIDDIWHKSGFKSRSSIFRILKKYKITPNRGPHNGPIKKRGKGKSSTNPEEES